MKMNKVVPLLLAVTLVTPLVLATSATASAQLIPKTYRGTWVAKPVYTYEMKHVKKNMAMPKLKVKVTSKVVKWQFMGYVPKGYNHKLYTLKIKKVHKHSVDLKGSGPCGYVNILAKSGKKLILAYDHGGDSRLSKVK